MTVLSLAMTLAADRAPGGREGGALGMVGAAMSLGVASGAVLGGRLGAQSPEAVFLWGGALMLVLAIFAALVLRDAPIGRRTECETLLAYAGQRLVKCPYGEDKPICNHCPVHCYKRTQREQVREVMRCAGPRMPLRHPWQALLHVFDKLRRVEHPRVWRRRGRGQQ